MACNGCAFTGGGQVTCMNDTNLTHSIPAVWVQNIFVVNHENKHDLMFDKLIIIIIIIIIVT
jgi:hypothetical protein